VEGAKLLSLSTTAEKGEERERREKAETQEEGQHKKATWSTIFRRLSQKVHLGPERKVSKRGALFAPCSFRGDLADRPSLSRFLLDAVEWFGTDAELPIGAKEKDGKKEKKKAGKWFKRSPHQGKGDLIRALEAKKNKRENDRRQ